MTVRKLIFIGTDGLPTENNGSYETGDFVSASTGVTNAGAPIKLDATGKLDPSLYGTNIPAADVAVANANGYFVATNVEGVLNELYTDILNQGTKFTVGTNAVAKGDLIYVSGNNTVQTYSTLTASNRGIGLAETAGASAGTTVAAANDVVIKGILTGATAGSVYYWSGTAHTTTIPTATGSYVWQTGVAVNATDLLVDVQIVKRNA